MNFSDFTIPSPKVEVERWQSGSALCDNFSDAAVALIFVSDYRGAGKDSERLNFNHFREYFYQLSKTETALPLYDAGDLVSGNSSMDTHFALQEILAACHKNKIIPIVIGGSVDFTYSLFSALNVFQQNIHFTYLSNVFSITNQNEELKEKSFLYKIFCSKGFNVQNFHLLGYQRHLNEMDSVQLMKEVGFDVEPLANLMNSPMLVEPYYRNSNLVTVNCDVIESFAAPFSIHPQVNGLNRREICAHTKEIGLSEQLKSIGFFNYNFFSKNELNEQLLAQMVWYLLEGISIQKSFPKEKKYETYVVLLGEAEYTFVREVYRDQWYFGEVKNMEEAIPCTKQDYENAKKGILNRRFLK